MKMIVKNICLLFFVSISFFAKSQTSSNYEVIKNIPYYPESTRSSDNYIKEQCVLDIYKPIGKTNAPVIVWFHGGGLTGGTKSIPKELLDYGYLIVSVEYRLSPKVKAPAYIEDAAASTAWVFQNIAKYEGNVKQIFLSGHSAGGYLDLMIGLENKWLAKHGISTNQIAGLIPLSPQVISHFTIREENNISKFQPVIDSYAPIYHIKKETPPIVLITGDREMELLGRYEENAYFFRMMKVIENPRVKLFELQGVDHGEMVRPGIFILMKEVGLIRNK
ncbi:MAG: alpha/beta hydrolase [Bacteroidota bacterium]|jgi:acetyl esterase/lipase